LCEAIKDNLSASFKALSVIDPCSRDHEQFFRVRFERQCFYKNPWFDYYTSHTLLLFLIINNLHRLLQKQNKDVATKLGIATIAMVTLPLAAFYVSFYFIFSNKQDPSIWSGAVAIVAVNIVIFGYVYSAFSEKDETTPSPGDAQGPRVGTFKRRTD